MSEMARKEAAKAKHPEKPADNPGDRLPARIPGRSAFDNNYEISLPLR